MTKILAHKSAGSLKNRRVLIQRNGEAYGASIVGPEMDFDTLAGYRKKGPTDPEKLQRALEENGYIFANLGVSTVLTMSHNGESYVVTARRDRNDLNDSVAMLISGYTDVKHLNNPQLAIFEEIAEEVLPTTAGGEVVRFVTEDGRELSQPFSDQYANHPVRAFLVEPSQYVAPGLASPITIEGARLAGNPGFYFQLPTDSAQLVFSYHLDFDGIDLNQVSMYHSEDAFNPKEKRLDVKLHEDGLYIIQLRDGDLTNRVFTMSRGELHPVDSRNILLSEAFAPKEEGIVARQNIPLEEYLRNI